jgi:hypothetical protein
MEQARQHRGAGAMGASNADNILFHERVGRFTMD